MLVAARRHNFRPNLRARNMTTGRGMADGHIIALSTHHSRCRILFWRLAGSSERAPGHKKRPGLIVVGCESLKRTPKWPYQALTDILTPVDDPQPMTPSDRPVILADIGQNDGAVGGGHGLRVIHWGQDVGQRLIGPFRGPLQAFATDDDQSGALFVARCPFGTARETPEQNPASAMMRGQRDDMTIGHPPPGGHVARTQVRPEVVPPRGNQHPCPALFYLLRKARSAPG